MIVAVVLLAVPRLKDALPVSGGDTSGAAGDPSAGSDPVLPAKKSDIHLDERVILV